MRRGGRRGWETRGEEKRREEKRKRREEKRREEKRGKERRGEERRGEERRGEEKKKEEIPKVKRDALPLTVKSTCGPTVSAQSFYKSKNAKQCVWQKFLVLLQAAISN